MCLPIQNRPYIVPIYFAYEPDHVYGFTTLRQKVEWMRSNPLVCVEVDEVLSHFRWSSVIVVADPLESAWDSRAPRDRRERNATSRNSSSPSRLKTLYAPESKRSFLRLRSKHYWARQAGSSDHPWKQLRVSLGKTGAPRTHVPSSAKEMSYLPKARPTECGRLGTPGLSGDLVYAGRLSAAGRA